MTKIEGHTKLPWTVGASWPELTAIYANSLYIAHTETGIYKDWVDGKNPLGSKVAAANAAFIVQACNHHYQLVEALRSAREWLLCVEGHLRDGAPFKHDLAKIDSVLSELEA